MVRIRTVCLTSIAAIALSAGGAWGQLEITSVSVNSSTVGLYELFEVRFNLNQDYANEFDPDQIDVVMTFTGPSAVQRQIPCYWTNQSPAWRARIAPLETGAHTCVIYASDSLGRSDTHTVNFTATTSSSKGFIKRDTRNPYYLAFSNGSPYTPIGHNLCWQFRSGFYDDYLTNMGLHGENWSRLWLCDFGQGIEWGHDQEPEYMGLGTYSQSNCVQLEWMLDYALQRGIYYQLCLDSFTAWNHDTFASWDVNKYNTANGGMCSIPIAVFSNAAAKELYKQRYRYLVARFAWHPGVLAWEFWNEADAIGSGGPWEYTYHQNRTVAAAWHAEMGAYIKSIDPYQHLITTSFVYPFQEADLYPEIWNLPEMDLVNLHQYDINVPVSHSDMILAARQFNKPIIFGEGNMSPVGQNQESMDPGGGTLHTQNWAGLVMEAGTVMSWWWDGYIHDDNLYHRWDGVVAFAQGEDWAPLNMAPIQVTRLTGPTNMKYYGSATTDHAILWIHNLTGGQVTDLSFNLPQVTVNSVQAEWWNTGNGTVIQTTTVTRQGGVLTFSSPAISGDIALKVRPTVPQPTIALSKSTLNPTATQGSNAPADSFTVQNSGSVTLSYSISDNVSWLSCSPTSGTSTGEADTINVTYSTSSLAVGTHNATITVSDPNATNNPQTIAVTLNINPVGGAVVSEDFESMPSWTSTFDASWGGQASWSIVSGGQSGNCLQVNRSNNGSSVKAKVYNLSTNTDYTISVYIRCPSGTATYWAECAYKLGSYTAQDFDQNGGTWTMIKKFDNAGVNGNGDVWTQYQLSFNSGGNSQISVGYKLGRSGGTAPTVKWDTLRVTSAGGSPTINRSPTTLSPSCTQGVNATNQTFTVANSGAGTLSYSVSDNVSWLSCTPTSGTSTGEQDTITVSYTSSGLTAGTYNGTITISDPNATNNPQTIAVTLTVNPPPPNIERSPATLAPSCTQGSNASNQTFTVQNTGGGTLSYAISDNQAWLSCSPSSGTSTGEADTITVSYTTSGLSAGTHNATITISDPNATNNPQTIAVTLTVNPSKLTVAEDFNSVPSWTSSFDAGWGGAASWSSVSGGQAGNCLQATRSNAGSSAKVKVYNITANQSYTISIYMRCPSSGDSYWRECFYKLGSYGAQDYDQNGGTWTEIKKFSNTGANGNGDTWVQYSKTFNSGSNTQISVGFKAGNASGTAPTIKWDTLRIQ
ncbi:MAG: hypothetical protein AMXMBFR13_35700 [Phycisphaerae bacterium]